MVFENGYCLHDLLANYACLCGDTGDMRVVLAAMRDSFSKYSTEVSIESRCVHKDHVLPNMVDLVIIMATRRWKEKLWKKFVKEHLDGGAEEERDGAGGGACLSAGEGIHSYLHPNDITLSIAHKNITELGQLGLRRRTSSQPIPFCIELQNSLKPHQNLKHS